MQKYPHVGKTGDPSLHAVPGDPGGVSRYPCRQGERDVPGKDHHLDQRAQVCRNSPVGTPDTRVDVQHSHAADDPNTAETTQGVPGRRGESLCFRKQTSNQIYVGLIFSCFFKHILKAKA